MKKKMILSLIVSLIFMAAASMTAFADEDGIATTVNSSLFKVVVEASGVVAHQLPDTATRQVAALRKGNIYDVVGEMDDFYQIILGEETAYVPASVVTLSETIAQAEDPIEAVREAIVNYAVTFVGNKYVWGGVDPNKGADCSGFTRYVYKNVAGVSLDHSAYRQSKVGKEISKEEVLPGDLLFYIEEGHNIDHVAIYAGDGMIVHASNAREGIKINKMREVPVKYVRILQDD